MIGKYFLVWFLLAIVAVVNGIIRRGTYGKHMADLAAHQLSTVTAVLATAAVVWIANRIWPIESATQAWAIGALWLGCTILFEFGFGHFVAGHSWQRLFADYNLMQGRVWSLFLAWIAVMPYVFFRLGNPSHGVMQ